MDTSNVDKAIAAVKARKAAKEAAKAKAKGETVKNETTTSETSTPSTPPAPKSKPTHVVLDPNKEARSAKAEQERKERIAALEKQRAERKALREEKRAARLAERATRIPHMSKVEKAAARLPALDTAALAILNDIKLNLSRPTALALAAHLQHYNRVESIKSCSGRDIEPGDEVEVVGGDPRFLGRKGVVVKAARIRCYVDFKDGEKPGYFFTSDVALDESVRDTEPAAESNDEPQATEVVEFTEPVEVPEQTGTDG